MEVSGVTRKYASGTYGDISANHKKYIKGFQADLVGIDVKSAKVDMGRARCTLIDTDNDVSEQYIVDNNIFEKDVTFKLGLQELNIADFVSLEPLVARNVNIKSPTEVEFLCEDARRLIGRNAEVFQFRQKTALNGALTAGASSCTVDSTTGFVVFHPSNPIWTEVEFVWPVIIVGDQEIIWYGGSSATTFTTFTARGTRTGTPAMAHEDNIEVKQGVIFKKVPGVDTESGPVLPLISVLMSRTNSSDAITHSFYDLVRYSSGFLGFGLGLTTSEVNVLSFERADGMIRNDLEDKSAESLGKFFLAYKPVNANKFISEYLRSLGLFMYVDRNGKLAIKNYDYLEIHNQYSADATLTNNDILDGSYKIGFDEVLNYIELSHTKNPLDESYDVTRRFQQDESQTVYGLTEKPFIIKHDFFSSTINDQEIFDGYLRRFMYLFANPPGLFKIQVPIEFIGIAPGDFVTLTCNRFKTYTGSATTAGWTALKSLITAQKIVWSGGKPVIELEGFTWEIMDKADLSIISATEIAAGSWDDSDLDIETSAGTGNTTTKTSHDAYYDEDAIEGEVFRLEVQLTVPASPINPNTDPDPASDSNDTILFDLALHLQDSVSGDTASDVFTEEIKGIRYDAGYSGADPNLSDAGAASATAWNLVFYFTSDTGSLTWDRIKVDAYNCRYAADGRDVGGGNIADLDIVTFHRYGLSTVSQSEVT
jgi:hypothetical protein